MAEVDRLVSIVEPHLKAATKDGVILGFDLALETLDVAYPIVSEGNRSWKAARAVIALAKAKYEVENP